MVALLWNVGLWDLFHWPQRVKGLLKSLCGLESWLLLSSSSASSTAEDRKSKFHIQYVWIKITRQDTRAVLSVRQSWILDCKTHYVRDIFNCLINSQFNVYCVKDLTSVVFYYKLHIFICKTLWSWREQYNLAYKFTYAGCFIIFNPLNVTKPAIAPISGLV